MLGFSQRYCCLFLRLYLAACCGLKARLQFLDLPRLLLLLQIQVLGMRFHAVHKYTSDGFVACSCNLLEAIKFDLVDLYGKCLSCYVLRLQNLYKSTVLTVLNLVKAVLESGMPFYSFECTLHVLYRIYLKRFAGVA